MINVFLIYIHLSLFSVMGWLDKPQVDFKQSIVLTKIASKSAAYSDKPVIKSTKLIFGEYRLVVISTVIYDSLVSDFLFLGEKVIKQQLQFYKNDILIKTFLFKPKKIIISTSHFKKLRVNENIIYSVSVVQGKDDWLYNIYGGGTTSNQSEYFGLFTREGKLLSYSYSSFHTYHRHGEPHEKKGNLKSTQLKYGIDDNQLFHPEHGIIIDY